jgi:hypothetical protein
MLRMKAPSLLDAERLRMDIVEALRRRLLASHFEDVSRERLKMGGVEAQPKA